MSAVNLGFTLTAEEEHGLQDDPGLVYHILDGLIQYSDSKYSFLKRSHTVQQSFSSRVASSLRTEILKAASLACCLSGHVQISFLQGLQVEDYACIALHFLAKILTDAGNACSSQWVQGSTPVDPHSGEDRRTGTFLFRCGIL